MKQHRVLLLSDHSLLSEGLANLLRIVPEVLLLGPRNVTGFSLEDLAADAPDVVLFAEQETDDVTANAVLFQILQHVPDLPVIQVGLSGSHIVRVYTSHSLPARSGDLIEMIRRLPLPFADGPAEPDSHPKE